MKHQFIYGISFLALCFALVAGVSFVTRPDKAWGDVQSLGAQKPTATDMDTMVTTLGKNYGVNWEDMVAYTVKAVNWNCVTPTNGSNAWTHACYLGT